MRSPFGLLRLIVNPRADGAELRALLPALRTALTARDVAHDVVQTGPKATAGDLAGAALDEGVRYLVAVGGDGTLQAVVNACFSGDRPRVDDAVIGIVSAGTAGDFARTMGLHLPAEPLASRLASPETMAVDVGVAVAADERGETVRRLFLNAARVGYGAKATELTERLPRLLGRFRHLLGAWAAIRATQRQRVQVELANGSQKLECVELVVANGQFLGGGMRTALRALPDNGRFNVLAFTGGPSQVFNLTAPMFQGQHLPHPQISEWQSPLVHIDTDPPLAVAIDGEPLGATPARFSLLAGALRLKI